MIHPSTELRFINKEVGYGVVATDLIPKGTITWVFDKLDREFDGHDLRKFEEPYRDILDRYCFRNNTGNYVLCWDNARFVNHSFRNNCLSTAYDLELAIRDIQPGEELTDDYGCLNIIEPFRANDEGARRKCVYPDDAVRYHRVWDKKLLAAFKQVARVDQPLRRMLSPSAWERCVRISRGEERMVSILNNYFDSEGHDRGTVRQSDASNPDTADADGRPTGKGGNECVPAMGGD